MMQPPENRVIQSVVMARCAELAALAERVELARRALLPSVERERWRGPARDAYEAELEQLRADLGWAAALLWQARECNLRAIGTLGGPWAMS